MAVTATLTPPSSLGDDDAHDLRRNQSRDSCRMLRVHVRVALDPIDSLSIRWRSMREGSVGAPVLAALDSITAAKRSEW